VTLGLIIANIPPEGEGNAVHFPPIVQRNMSSENCDTGTRDPLRELLNSSV